MAGLRERRRAPGGRGAWPAAVILFVLGGAAGLAAELKPRTLAVFDRYVALSEARMEPEVRAGGRFIWTDGLPPERRRAVEAALRRGEVFIDAVRTRERGKNIDVPDGMIHHWVGVVFVPGVRAPHAVAMLRQYDRHAQYYAPNIVRSRLLASEDGRVRFFLRFHVKKVLTVTLNTEHEGEFVTVDPTRTYSRIHSTRIAEVAEAGTPAEHEKPVGKDSGFMWRMNTYWRFLERDGGTYVQCESITLSRDMPFGLGWIIRPFVTEVPKESLEFTLGRTRLELLKPSAGR